MCYRNYKKTMVNTTLMNDDDIRGITNNAIKLFIVRLLLLSCNLIINYKCINELAETYKFSFLVIMKIILQL